MKIGYLQADSLGFVGSERAAAKREEGGPEALLVSVPCIDGMPWRNALMVADRIDIRCGPRSGIWGVAKW